MRADPEDFFAQCYLGLALREAMKLDEAAQALERAHEINPRFAEPVPAWGAASLADATVKTLLNLGETERALRVAARASAAVPADWRSAKAAGSLSLEAGKLREAAGWFERVLDVNPFDAESQLSFAETQEKLARGREKTKGTRLAARAYRAAKALDGRNPAAYLGLGRALVELGRTDEARAVIGELRRFDPDNEEAFRCIVEVLDAIDNYIPEPLRPIDQPFLMPIEDVFSIKGRGTVGTGRRARVSSRQCARRWP